MNKLDRYEKYAFQHYNYNNVSFSFLNSYLLIVHVNVKSYKLYH